MFRFRSLVVFCGAAMVFAAVAFPPLTTFGQARQATADPCTGARDLHLTNGRFVTMDGRGSTATEVTIQDGRFTAVGPRGNQRLSPCTREINLRGRTVVPGLIDNHNHIVLLGIRPGYHTPLEGDGVDRRGAGGAQGTSEGCPRRRVHHVDGRMESGAVHREAAPDAGRARCRYVRSPCPRLSSVHRTGGHEYKGQGVPREQGCRRQRHGADRRECAVARGAQCAARRTDLRRQEARHTGRDGVLRQRRRHHERRHGRIQSTWHARPSGLVRSRHAGQRQPVHDVRPGRRPAPRRQDDDAAARVLPDDGYAAGCADPVRAPAQRLQWVRRRHDAHFRHRRVRVELAALRQQAAGQLPGRAVAHRDKKDGRSSSTVCRRQRTS